MAEAIDVVRASGSHEEVESVLDTLLSPPSLRCVHLLPRLLHLHSPGIVRPLRPRRHLHLLGMSLNLR